jgi:hypothetical protein
VVPADATNQTLHTYRAIVTYEGDNGPTKVNQVYWEDAGVGGGLAYTLDHSPIVPDSETIYYDDLTTHTVTTLGLNAGYTINDYTGAITLSVAPPATAEVRVKYKYCEDVITGTGSTLVGYLDHVPVVAGSAVVLREDDTQQNVTVLAATTDYTLDPASGKLTMVVAPAANQVISAYYEYYGQFTSGGSIAVVSADQATYTTLWRRYMETWNTYTLTLTAGTPMDLTGDAQAARMKAEIEYREGNFAAAAASMQTALDTLNSALGGEASFQSGLMTGVTNMVTGGAGVVDAYGAKLNAEATNITETTDAQVKKLKGEASKAANTGVFYIMLGVFTLLVGIAAIIWALAQFVVARGPSHHEHT